MLELDRVAKLYGAKVIFKDVSCAFASGSVSLLVGGNGAGKSTLMRIMAGLSRPSAGSVRLAESGPRAEGPRLGYLGHATFLYPGLTALENLAFWRTAHGLRLSGAGLSAMLERVGLAAHAHERAGIFSRGMAQRLNLARVLMLEPDLLLLDITMPEIDGFGVLEAMNQYHWIEETPVIMISAEDSYTFVERAYDLGASDYITRPFDARVVCRRVSNTLMLYAK